MGALQFIVVLMLLCMSNALHSYGLLLLAFKPNSGTE